MIEWLTLLGVVAVVAGWRVLVQLNYYRAGGTSRRPLDAAGAPSPYAVILPVVVLIVALVVALATVVGSKMAWSPSILGIIAGIVGLLAISLNVRALVRGRIPPWARGSFGTYEARSQPKRFWASFLWNGLCGVVLIASPFMASSPGSNDPCFENGSEATASHKLAACNAYLSNKHGADDRAGALSERGIAHHYLAQYNEAAADYSQSLALRPGDSNTLFNRALIREQLHQGDLALADFNAAIERAPSEARYHVERGDFFVDAGAQDAAIQDFTRALEFDASGLSARAGRGLSYAWKNDPARAEADFKAVDAVDPRNFAVLDGRAVLPMKRNDWKQAIAYASQVIAQSPKDVFALHLRANAYWKDGQVDKAGDDDDAISAISPRAVAKATTELGRPRG